MGLPTIDGGAALVDTRFGQGVRVADAARLAFPTSGNLNLAAGTIAFWAQLPERWPATPNKRQYLLAASAHPDEGPVYTGTLALRRDAGPDGAPRWNFWTTPESGAPGRDDLAAPDTLRPGWHHFALSWDRASGTKALFIDGQRVASTSGAALPADVGGLLELGRWAPGSNAADVVYDELAIYNHELDITEVAALAGRDTPIAAGTTVVHSPELPLALKAEDDGGAIVSMQLGVNGDFGDPQPYAERPAVLLPSASGIYTIGARLLDRAGNSAIVSATVELALPDVPAPTPAPQPIPSPAPVPGPSPATPALPAPEGSRRLPE